jgi:hypothetical protein
MKCGTIAGSTKVEVAGKPSLRRCLACQKEYSAEGGKTAGDVMLAAECSSSKSVAMPHPEVAAARFIDVFSRRTY